jgi:hypothetical protein
MLKKYGFSGTISLVISSKAGLKYKGTVIKMGKNTDKIRI